MRLSPADRQRAIDADNEASRLLALRTPPPTAPDMRFAPGVQVVMSTHKRPGLLKECLASIETAMKGTGVRWTLLIGNDGGDEETQEVLKAHKSGAASFVYQSFPKAGTVSEAKNRVLVMAKAHETAYPWLLWMDDDDLFRRERVTELLPMAIKGGHKLAAGHWLVQQGNRTSNMDVFKAVTQPHSALPPQATVIHSSLVPADGRLFNEEVSIWEDVLAWQKLRKEGIELIPLNTSRPVFTARIITPTSASRPNGDAAVAKAAGRKFIPRLRVVIGVHQGDAASAIRTLEWCATLGRQDADLVVVTEGEMPDLWPSGGFTTKTVLTHTPLKATSPVTRVAEAVVIHQQVFRVAFPDTPFFMFEHDSIPLTRHWLAQIVEAHGPDMEATASGNWITYIKDKFGPFLNGVALYPTAYSVADIPLGAEGSDRTNNPAYHPHLTFKANRRMVHTWGHEFIPGLVVENGIPTFPTQAELDFLRSTWPAASLFHRCKDGSLIDRLKEVAL